MNKFFKILIAVLGAVNVAFNIFVPVAMALVLISVFELTYINIVLIMIIGILSTIYRAVEEFIR